MNVIPKNLFPSEDKENQNLQSNLVIEKILENDDRRYRFSQRPNSLGKFSKFP